MRGVDVGRYYSSSSRWSCLSCSAKPVRNTKTKHSGNLSCRRIQCDEIWAFCYAKDKNLPVDKQNKFGFGSVWTWTAIDADTKLIASWMVGNRDTNAAHEFIQDLPGRLANRVQLSTDGHKPYLEAVHYAFSGDIDYAQLIKIYGADRPDDARYSPAQCIGTERRTISGSPDRKPVSTSYVERQILTMRMGMRRFTRLTNGFRRRSRTTSRRSRFTSKHYNFVRVHQTLKVTPQWRMAYQIGSGRSAISFGCWKIGKRAYWRKSARKSWLGSIGMFCRRTTNSRKWHPSTQIIQNICA
jgi:IS1 family transposase